MTNLLTVAPDFAIQAFSHIIPSLEKHAVTSTDLLTIDAVEIARRARVPTEEVRKLVDVVRSHVQGDGHAPWLKQEKSAGAASTISLLDDELDRALNGGIHTGFVTEIAGESAAGKTQCLLTLLLSVQLSGPLGLSKNALYISTEAQLSTKRLAQILHDHPKLSAPGSEQAPSLDRVISTHVRDLEAQEHILRFQVPVIIERHNIGLIIVDSIAANYRAELDKTSDRRAAESVAQRSLQIGRIGAYLRALARTTGVAIVLANQVADRFDLAGNMTALFSQSTQRSRPATPPHNVTIEGQSITLADREELSDVLPSVDLPLDLDHQQRFFTGWGDDAAVAALKNPSLGLTWTCQLATRIVLLKTPIYIEGDRTIAEEKVLSGWIRTMKIVFSAWAKSSTTPFEIWQGGIRACLVESS